MPYNWLSAKLSRRSFRSVVANVLDCDIIVSEFELLSYFYVHFRTNTLLFLLCNGLNGTTTVLSQRWLLFLFPKPLYVYIKISREHKASQIIFCGGAGKESGQLHTYGTLGDPSKPQLPTHSFSTVIYTVHPQPSNIH